MAPAVEEFIEFIAGGTTSESVAAYRPSEVASTRVFELIQRKKNDGLTEAETAELAQCLQLEHLMRLAKARARQRLAGRRNSDVGQGNGA